MSCRWWGVGLTLTVWFSLMEMYECEIPKIVWTYVPVLEEVSVLQRLCIGNIKKYAEQSKYTFTIITKDNYLKLFQDSSQMQTVINLAHIDKQITLATLIQLKILEQYGGVWIDSTMMLVETLDWLATIKNQRFINNRIDNPEIVMFYEPSWLDQTHKRTQSKIQKLVVAPQYQTWFIAAAKDSLYIKNLKKLFIQTVIVPYQKAAEFFSLKSISIADYLLNQNIFLPWLAQATVILKQQQLDNEQYPIRQLAINHYKISAIDVIQSAKSIEQQARNHVHLTTKYLAELTLHELNRQLHYGIKFNEEVAHELAQTMESDFINLQHFHASAALFCDQAIIPLRYVVQQSVLDKYLIQGSGIAVQVFDEEYVRHHCEPSFLQIYWMVLTRYVAPVLAFAGNVFLARKAILVFKPEWGMRRKSLEPQ